MSVAVETSERVPIVPPDDSEGWPEEPNDFDPDGPLTFEPEQDPAEFFRRSDASTASGAFEPLIDLPVARSKGETADWEIDLSPAKISGEGINSDANNSADDHSEDEFLSVRKGGKKSTRRTVALVDTRLSIDHRVCTRWASRVRKRGFYFNDDVENLVQHCEGNCHSDDLHHNVQRTLEDAGFEPLDVGPAAEMASLWDPQTTTNAEDLTEAIISTLTRELRLPGTGRFAVDKARESQLTGALTRATQQLELTILASPFAVSSIIEAVSRLRERPSDARSVTLTAIKPALVGHPETDAFFHAARALVHWHSVGRPMDGKRRREAAEALRTLNLSDGFVESLARSVSSVGDQTEESARFEERIENVHQARRNLILEHLPYARRFAARNVGEGESLEDVFQVVFVGLERSTRRFDPGRGVRFVVYCNNWMLQSLQRWRHDEAALVRIPAHRHIELARLDRALSAHGHGAVAEDTMAELACAFGSPVATLRMLSRIPRDADFLCSVVEWEQLLEAPPFDDPVIRAEIRNVVAETLDELAPREADIIRRRFGIGYPDAMTLEEIGQVYGLTRERIRQIEAKGIQSLMHPSRELRLRALIEA